MSETWKDYVPAASEIIEADEFASAEMFVANKEAVLKYQDDLDGLFEYATLFGASLILQIIANNPISKN